MFLEPDCISQQTENEADLKRIILEIRIDPKEGDLVSVRILWTVVE